MYFYAFDFLVGNSKVSQSFEMYNKNCDNLILEI